MKPEITPISTEIVNAKIMFEFVKAMPKSNKELAKNKPPKTTNKPMIPPSKLSITASVKNCVRMKIFFAPKAFCMPMSDVLSFTETNIIFAIPNPPTIIEKPPITQPASLSP
jgi:hypothetical protein